MQAEPNDGVLILHPPLTTETGAGNWARGEHALQVHVQVA